MSSLKLVQRPAISLPEFDNFLMEEVAETGGMIFPDGRCIELIKDDAGCLSLLDLNAKEPAQSVECAGRTYVPPTIHSSLLTAMTLPAKRIDCGSTMKVFSQICAMFIDKGISDHVARQLTYFAISTWFQDSLSVTPCLVITGPEVEARVVMQLLACVVRHALPLAQIDLAGLRSLPLHLQPTLLIGRVNPSLYRSLFTFNHPSAYLLRGGELVDLCCVKVIYAGTTPADGVCSDAVLNINIGPCHGKLPIINHSKQEQIVAEFQPRLLDYHLKHAMAVRNSDFDVPALSANLRVIARALGSCIVDAPELQTGVTLIFEDQQELLRVNNSVDPVHVTIEALLARCHTEQGACRVGVGEIADAARSILEDRGEATRVKTKMMGRHLRLLGFQAERDSHGYAICLTEGIRRRIHSLAHDHQVLAVEDAVTTCLHCTETIPA